MSQVDYDAMLSQLHLIGRNLRHTNKELRRRCLELEERFAAPPFGYYNRYVNQLLIKNVRTLSGWVRKAVRGSGAQG
jgi:hypothetical protein